MKRHISTLLLASLTFASVLSAMGDFVSELWGNAPSCHHLGTLKMIDARRIELDLSALPRAAAIQRAVLHANFQRRDYRQTIEIHA